MITSIFQSIYIIYTLHIILSMTRDLRININYNSIIQLFFYPKLPISIGYSLEHFETVNIFQKNVAHKSYNQFHWYN